MKSLVSSSASGLRIVLRVIGALSFCCFQTVFYFPPLAPWPLFQGGAVGFNSLQANFELRTVEIERMLFALGRPGCWNR
jgi:hypothetical protein